MQWSVRVHCRLPVFPQLNHLSHRISAIQSTPHMAHSLRVSRSDIRNQASVSLLPAAYTCLADRRQNRPARQVSVQGEEALQVHVQIFSDSLGV